MKRGQIEQRKNPKRLCKRATARPTGMGIFSSFPEEITQVKLRCTSNHHMFFMEFYNLIK
jgi:hypothetical protein